MQFDCSAQRICLDIQTKLSILKVRPIRETYPPGSPLVKDFLKPLSQMALDLLSGEKACHVCKKAAHGDTFRDGFDLLSAAIQSSSLQLPIRNTTISSMINKMEEGTKIIS